MTTGADRYSGCVQDALDRLYLTGFEFGPDFAMHAPMVAEALATLGCETVVPGWIENNKKWRRSYPVPAGLAALPDDPREARQALGDYARVADWVRYFERRFAERPWTEVLAEWWAPLLDGAFAAFTHGLIRTAHAVRSLTTTATASPLQLDELARGLGYWSARYAPVPWKPAAAGPHIGSADEVPAALSELTAHYAGRYAELAPDPPVPQIHSITAPSAVRLVLPVLPAELHVRTYEVAAKLAAGAWKALPERPGRGPAASVDYRPPAPEDLVGAAVEAGEEHAIKIAEASLREYRENPDERYLAAAHTLITKCR